MTCCCCTCEDCCLHNGVMAIAAISGIIAMAGLIFFTFVLVNTVSPQHDSIPIDFSTYSDNDLRESLENVCRGDLRRHVKISHGDILKKEAVDYKIINNDLAPPMLAAGFVNICGEDRPVPVALSDVKVRTDTMKGQGAGDIKTADAHSSVTAATMEVGNKKTSSNSDKKANVGTTDAMTVFATVMTTDKITTSKHTTAATVIENTPNGDAADVNKLNSTVESAVSKFATAEHSLKGIHGVPCTKISGERLPRESKHRGPHGSHTSECESLVEREMDRISEKMDMRGVRKKGENKSKSTVQLVMIIVGVVMNAIFFLASILLMYGVALEYSCLFLPWLTLVIAYVIVHCIIFAVLLILGDVKESERVLWIVLFVVVPLIVFILVIVAICCVWRLLRRIVWGSEHCINEGIIESMHLLISGRN